MKKLTCFVYNKILALLNCIKADNLVRWLKVSSNDVQTATSHN